MENHDERAHKFDRESGANFTYSEIRQQPDIWRKTLDIISVQHPQISRFVEEITRQPDYLIILTGAGSSDFVGKTAHVSLNGPLNQHVLSIPTTDMVASPTAYLSPDRPTLLVSFARSGNSPESVAAIDVANQINKDTKHLVITCNHKGRLAELAHTDANVYAVLLPEESNDRGFAMTSSFSSMYLAVMLALSPPVRFKKLEAQVEDVCRAAEDLLNDAPVIERIVHDFDFQRIVYLGSGPLKGIALESSLKMLELTRGEIAVLPNTPLGFRHGPKSFLNDETLTVFFLSSNPYTYRYEFDLLKELYGQRKGNKTIAVTGQADPDLDQWVDLAYVVKAVGADPALLPLIDVVFAQLLAFFKSVALGLTPDNPFPSGEVNRVVKGVKIYPIDAGSDGLRESDLPHSEESAD